MNGIHDMGGMDGFGKVVPEPNEPNFHADWEARVMAMVRAMGAKGAYNIDASRFARESIPPEVYLSSSYYKKWFLALEQHIIELGYTTADEVAAGRALHNGTPLPRGKFEVADLDRVKVRGSFDRAPQAPALFAPGDRVHTKNINPLTHTRLPRYVRGHTGIVERVNGCHVFPDSAAHGHGDDPQWLYTVVFSGKDLWGEGSDPTVKVSVDAFEPYLERA